ncbi:UrcA family protein [Polymorphobacter sp. PAMC 29334]|uniref:UrcA family protein n=1 Tax=Polymorphobacter sp. PAMC 29334 TaxID=2862331 RepID=UPI001C66CEC0|nr:UrcA family protein [Polymorphobacter sp. PAMC 29334]QYE34360.1 UrcA family protein [Polymorphobacter sp. PAMC 29334]
MFTASNSIIARTVLGTVGTALCAGLCLVGATAPAHAGSIYDTARSQNVSYADLNLGSTEGRKILERRIKTAAHAVCVTGRFDLQSMKEENRCVRVALDSAKPKVVAAASDRLTVG